jgi:lipopolysaccharide biosynthesis glycosyltransferase
VKVYLGYEPREQRAYDVAHSSLRYHRTFPLTVEPLDSVALAAKGLLWRPTDERSGIYDLVSNAPCSTHFAVSRFLVPILAQTGFAVFTDCDVVFMADIKELFDLADESKAVQVVKHKHVPTLTVKMDGAVQLPYTRKNWSSVMLWNCDHPANRRLSLHDVNTRRGLDLHQFYWLHDNEIGDLPVEWNWLVGEQPQPPRPKIAHFTNGGPFLKGWESKPHDDIWLEAYSRQQRQGLIF